MTKRLVVMAVLVVGFGAAAINGCGGSDSAPSGQALCIKLCEKPLMCANEPTTACAAQCMPTTGAGGTSGGPTCTNANQILNAIDACLNMSCETYLNCLGTVPACQMGGGAGTTGNAGTSGGSAGTTGSAGTSGTAGCASCVKFQACCLAATPASCTTDVGAACMQQPAANQAATNSACATGLTQIAPLFPNIAACQ